jgi:hypothetical protein
VIIKIKIMVHKMEKMSKDAINAKARSIEVSWIATMGLRNANLLSKNVRSRIRESWARRKAAKKSEKAKKLS